MPIEFTVDSIDSVDESLRSAYVESEGKFQFDPDKYAEIKASGLKKKNSELIGKEKQLKTELAKFEKFKEIDPDELEEFLESKTAAPDADGKAESNGKAGNDPALRTLDKQYKKLQAKYDADSGAWQKERDHILSELQHYKLTVPLKDIALKAGVLPDDIDIVLLETAKRFRLTDTGKIEVLDDDGDPTTDSPEKFFKEIYKEKRPKFYAATGAGGSGSAPGARNSAGGNKVMVRSRFAEMSPQSQMDFIRAGGKVTD